jgi:hypothetical protein
MRSSDPFFQPQTVIGIWITCGIALGLTAWIFGLTDIWLWVTTLLIGSYFGITFTEGWDTHRHMGILILFQWLWLGAIIGCEILGMMALPATPAFYITLYAPFAEELLKVSIFAILYQILRGLSIPRWVSKSRAQLQEGGSMAIGGSRLS